MLRIYLFAGLLTAVNAPSACTAGDQTPAPGIACTLQAVTSVVGHVNNAAGAPITGALVQYSVNNSDFVPAESAFNGVYSMAYETTGNFVVQVTVGAQPMQEKSIVVSMDSVGCHVVTQDMYFTFN